MSNNFEISLVVFMPNINTNHAITYINSSSKSQEMAISNQQQQFPTI